MYTNACADARPLLWIKPLIKTLSKRLSDRAVGGVESNQIVSLWNHDIRVRLESKVIETAADRWARHNQLFCELAVDQNWKEADVAYAYNAAALEIFEKAKRLGLKCVLDQTAAAWRANSKSLDEESRNWPNWEENPADLDRSGIITAREEEEWALADKIICGSQFVADSIASVGGPSHKCRVVPYPIPAVAPVSRDRRRSGNTTHVLYVGTMQLRKGIQYFWQAAKRAEEDIDQEVCFKAIGPTNLSAAANQNLASDLNWTGSVPRSDVQQALADADIFVLPTLSEGSANVCLEALAAGLPVITTSNSGIELQPNVIHIPIRDAQAINSAIGKVLRNSHEPVLPKSRSIQDYGSDLIKAIEE